MRSALGFLIVCASLVLIGPAVSAAPRAGGAAALAPFIDEQVVLVVEYDLTAFKAEPIRQWIEQIVAPIKAAESRREQLRAGLAGALEHVEAANASLVAGGVQRIYFVSSVTDMQGGGRSFVVVPVPKDANAQKMQALFEPGRPGASLVSDPKASAVVMDGAVVVGQKPVLDRLRKARAVARPELGQALTAAGNAPVRIAVLPSPQSLQMLGAVSAMLPPQAAEVVTALGGIRWIGVGVSLPPAGGIRMKVQAKDADAAKALAGAIQSGLDGAVEQWPAGKSASFQRFATVFRPMVMHDRVLMSADQKTVGDLIGGLGPALIAAREAASGQLEEAVVRRALMETAMGCVMHAIENEGHFPQNWEQITQRLGHPPGEFPEIEGGPPAGEEQHDVPALVYVRPTQTTAQIRNQRQRMLAYQAFEGEPDEVRILLMDGTVHKVSHTRFQQLLKIAKDAGGVEVRQ